MKTDSDELRPTYVSASAETHAMSVLRNDNGQRRERTRASEHAARTPKGHPLREARRQRAAARLDVHVYDPDRCKDGCPKRGAA